MSNVNRLYFFERVPGLLAEQKQKFIIIYIRFIIEVNFYKILILDEIANTVTKVA